MTTTAYAQRAKPATDDQKERIEEYRAMLQQSFDMSWGELADLQGLAAEGVIDPSDTDMLEAAGVSEWEATGYGEGNPEDIEGNDLITHPDDVDYVAPSYGPSFFDADEIARVNSLSDPMEWNETPDRFNRGVNGEQWECGSCGAVTDPAVAVDGEPFHAADADCRAVAPFDANMRAAWERSER